MGSTAAIVGGVIGALALVGIAIALGVVYGTSSSSNVTSVTPTASTTPVEPPVSVSPTMNPGVTTESGTSDFVFPTFDGLSNTAVLNFTKTFSAAPALQSVTLTGGSAALFGPMSVAGNLQMATTSGADLQLFHMDFPFGTPLDRPLTVDSGTGATGISEFPAFEWNGDVYFARTKNTAPLNAIEWFKTNDGAAAVSVTSPTQAFTVAGFAGISALTMYSVDATTIVAVGVSAGDNLGTRGFISTDNGATWPTAVTGTFWPATGNYDYIKSIGSPNGAAGIVVLLTKTTANVWSLLSSINGLVYSVANINFVTAGPVGRPSTAQNGAQDQTMVAFMRSTTLPGLWQIPNATTATGMTTINIADRPTNAATSECAYLTAGENRPTLYVAEADSPFEVKVWQNDQEDGMGTWTTSAVAFTPAAVIGNMRIAKVPGVLFMIYQSNSSLYFTRTMDLSGLTGWTSSAVLVSNASADFTIVPVDGGNSFGIYWFKIGDNDLQWTIVPGSTVATVEWTVQG